MSAVALRREQTRVWAEMGEQPEVLGRALAANEPLLDRLRTLAPLRIRLIGHGSSGHAARFGAAVVEARLGVPCDVVPAPDLGGGSALYGGGDLVLALSQSGRTPSVLSAARRAVAAGAHVVALTNDPDSPLAASAHGSLSCHAGEEVAVPATKTFLAQAALLLALAAGTGVASRALAPIAAALEAPPAGVPTAPLRPGMVVGSRSAAPIAAEVALKFAEIAGHAVLGVDAAEALHGPVAAGDGPLLALAARPDPNLDLLRVHRDVVQPALPLDGSGDADADALVLAVIGQIMALDLALACGRDPDSPPHLSKVTRSA
ncbi:MAG TPA: SIS domain-containing protein [Candidatus Dormibacteraeota bacterium]|nr:SIS domain-containing protein [Candidatus Dormibacteraeota bacterium]